MAVVTSGKRATQGKHAGQARLEDAGSRRPRGSAGLLVRLGLTLGVTAAVVAWGYLVYLAIDFGTSAREGDHAAWVFLALATVGAIACLFVALTLGMRLVAAVRTTAASPTSPRPPGGRRAAR
jgi:hypothetical protein